jgi:hypothetical protein
MSGAEILISFDGASPAQRNRLAQDLEQKLRSIGIEASRQREREDAQDVGTILSVLLAAPAAVTLAKALQAWLVRNNQVTASIKVKDLEVSFRNLRSEDVPGALEEISKLRKGTTTPQKAPG